MARREKAPDKPASKAYLMSFGDTMTTLLAFFIVLNSLAEEQTGANLHAGTGSFARAINSFGLQGKFSEERASNAISRSATSPLYMVDSTDQQAAQKDGTGPDDEDDQLRVIDREEDEFARFIQAMERHYQVERLPEITGEITFDYFNPLRGQPPLLTPAYAEAFRKVVPLLYSDRYEVQVIVWGTTPSSSAWTRATRQAHQLVEELGDALRLTPQQQSRVSGVGRAWIDGKARRPVLSLVVRKVQSPK